MSRPPLSQRLAAGLSEAIEHARGERELRTTTVANEPPEVAGATLAAIRRQTGMSQRQFAGLFNVSLRTLQSWEQGVRVPSQASRRLIQVFADSPAVVCRSAGLPEVELRGVEVRKTRGGRSRLVVAAARSAGNRP